MNHMTNFASLIETIDQCMLKKSTVMVTLIGSGGKTTTLFKLLEKYRDQKSILVSTTTAMMHPKANLKQIIYDEGQIGLNEHFDFEPIGLFQSHRIENNKVIGVLPEVLDRLYLQSNFDLILVEGDGSKGKPLKGFASYEPVIPSETDIVLILIGWDGLHQPLSEDIVHRSDLFQKESNMVYKERINLSHVMKVLLSRNGPRSKIPEKAKCIVVFNKVNTYATQQDLQDLLVLRNTGIDLGFDAMILTEMQP